MTPHTEQVAMQMAYLMAGVESVLVQHRIKTRLLGNEEAHPCCEGGGHIGFVSEVVPLADMVATEIAKRDGQDFPGVFEYEVTEGIGKWYAENYEATTEQMLEYVASSVEEWFKNAGAR